MMLAEIYKTSVDYLVGLTADPTSPKRKGKQWTVLGTAIYLLSAGKGLRTYSWTSKGVKGYVYKRAKRASVKRIWTIRFRPFTATHCYNRLPNLIFTFLIPHIQTTVDKTDFCQGFPYFNYICFLASVQIWHRLMPAVPDYLQKILLWHRCYKILLSVCQISILEQFFRSPLFLLLSNVWHFCDINAITQLFLFKIYIDRRGILCYIIYQKGWWMLCQLHPISSAATPKPSF